ncbi:uncharacterized protein LOC144121782 [Amblyomma americanum]
MAGVFRSSLQTTVEIAVGDITKTVTAVRSSDGSCIPDGNGYLYEGADGERYVLVFEDEHTPASQPRASDESGIGASASAEAVAPIPASAEADLELWSGAKTRFLIDKYVQFKDLVGQKGGFRYVSIPDSTQHACKRKKKMTKMREFVPSGYCI